MEGWICSRCQRSNAPWVKTCNCYPIVAPDVNPLPIEIYLGHIKFKKIGGEVFDIPPAILDRAKNHL